MKSRSRKPTHAPSGFSLLELVVVMAIIAILATLAMPLFLSKVPREQVEESMPIIKFVQGEVERYYKGQNPKAMPASNEVAGLQPPDKIVGVFVESVTVLDGAVNVKFRPDANGKLAGKIISWRPAVSSGNPDIPWICGYQKEPPSMQIGGANATNVTRDALPLRCLK